MILYDAVFIIGYHRTANTALSLLQQLSVTKKVAVIFYNEGTDLQAKTGKNKAKTIGNLKQRCTIINISEKFKTKLLIIQQHNYEDVFINCLKKNSTFEKDFIVMSFASLGLFNYDAVVSNFNTASLLTQDLKFLHFLAKKRNSTLYKDRKIIEIGLPTEINPILESQSIDWLILAPTTFSLQSTKAKNQFLANAIRFINNYKSDIFIFKSHNGNVRDSLGIVPIPHLIKKFITYTGILNLLIRLINRKIFQKRLYIGPLLNILLRLEFSSLIVRLDEIDKNSHIPAENFIAMVNKGVLGGFSNTIWGAAYFDKRYFNLASITDYNDIFRNDKSKKTLGVNLEFLIEQPPGKPGCELVLNENIKNISATQTDLVKFILCQM